MNILYETDINLSGNKKSSISENVKYIITVSYNNLPDGTIPLDI